jgi:hypothetical protein
MGTLDELKLLDLLPGLLRAIEHVPEKQRRSILKMRS